MAIGDDPLPILPSVRGARVAGAYTAIGNVHTRDATADLGSPLVREMLRTFGIDASRLAGLPPQAVAQIIADITRHQTEVTALREEEQALRERLTRFIQDCELRRDSANDQDQRAPVAVSAVWAAMSGQHFSGDGTAYAFAQTIYQAYTYAQVAAAYDGSPADRALGDRIIRDVSAANAAIRAAGDRPWSPETQQAADAAITSIIQGQETVVPGLRGSMERIDGAIGRRVSPGAAITAEHDNLDRHFRHYEANRQALESMLVEAETASGMPEETRTENQQRRHQDFARYLADRLRGMYGGDRAALQSAIDRVIRFRDQLNATLGATSAAEIARLTQQALTDNNLTAAERALLEQHGQRVLLDQQIIGMQERLRTTTGGPSPGDATPGGPTPHTLSPELQAILRRIEAVRDALPGTAGENINDLAREFRAITGQGRGAEFLRRRTELEERLRLNPNDADARRELNELRTQGRERLGKRQGDEARDTDYDQPEVFFARFATITDQERAMRELEAYGRYQRREQLVLALGGTATATVPPVVMAEATTALPAAGQAPKQQAALEPERPANGQPRSAPDATVT